MARRRRKAGRPLISPRRKAIQVALEILVFGLLTSTLYALSAVGFTLIFGVARVLNLAHGAFMITGAFVFWWVSGLMVPGATGLAFVAGVASVALLALLVGDTLVHYIHTTPRIPAAQRETIVFAATLLLAIIIDEAWVIALGPERRAVSPLVTGFSTFHRVAIPYSRLLASALAVAMIAGLWLFITRTQVGRVIRAASMDSKGVALIGVPARQVYRRAWVISGALAGVAGIFLASFLGLSPNMDLPLVVNAFSIVVLGGLGSIPGSLVASLIIGLVEMATARLISAAYSDLPMLALLVLTLYFRPRGLMGTR